ncbi:MAG: cation transporter, partial [Candidatus Saganbacteria bacterium]|nr:cation transporter [Candidatus Saganbacteria bacterium]
MIEHEHKPVMDFGKNIKALTLTLFFTLLIMFAEFFGGLISGSLALLSDAGHMLTDVIALSLSLLALTFSRRPATPEK